jgi:AcrR family transcriptional regulator
MTRITGMARWEGDAAGRLREAAMRLYVEQGYEQTTVAQIAAQAGVTARTFFRHFTDKREVLFAGASVLREGVMRALEAAPAGASPREVVAAALEAAGTLLGQQREHSRLRQTVIEANDELRERELIKMATMAAAMAAGLRERGVAEPDATLAAEAGTVVLRVAFEAWVAARDDASLNDYMRDAFDRLDAITGQGR